MKIKKNLKKNSAAKLIALTGGLFAGIGGIQHGIGEIIQGNVIPKGFVFDTWTVEPMATNMGGEPAMTLIPNLLLTGILTILISLVVIFWAILFIEKKKGDIILVLLSIIMLFTGGGFAPPIIGIIAGIGGVRIKKQKIESNNKITNKSEYIFARLWPFIFSICIIVNIFIGIGSIILVFFFGFNNPNVIAISFLFVILCMILSIITGKRYDNNIIIRYETNKQSENT